VTAAEAIAVVDLEEANVWLLSSRLWAAAPLPWRSLRRLNPGGALRMC
jgi:hypothetical protein